MRARDLHSIAAGRGPLDDKKLAQAERWVEADWESHDLDRDAVKLISRLLETVRSRSPRPHVRVVAAVMRREGKVYIQRRRAGDKRGGLWEFAGGKQERGETDEIALARELDEELGITAIIGEKLAEVYYEYPESSCNVVLYLVTEWSGEIVSKAADATDWVDRDEFTARVGSMVPSMNLLFRQDATWWM